MVGFLIAGLIVFVAVGAASNYGPAILARYGSVVLARLQPPFRKHLFVLGVAVCVGVALVSIGFGDDAIRWLETSDGFRAFLGAIFGSMAALLVRGWRRVEREGGGADAPWWARASGLIPLALTGLFIFAVIAPRGEFDLGFLSSVKTPFVEAQFNRNETEHRLEIESEPEGFFTLGRTGLGEALYLAWADLYFWEAIVDAGGGPFGTETAAAKQGEAAIALDFALKVLQPIAACIRQGDALLGDQKIATDVLGRIGHRLARALILAREADTIGIDPLWTDEKQNEARDLQAKHNAAAVEQLKGLQGMLDETLKPLMPVLEATVGPRRPYTHNICDRGDGRWGDPDRSIAETDPHILHAALRLPATIHSASMFFLWSGNPRAAATVLNLTPRSHGFARYPGIAFTRGFTTRWTDAKNPRPSAYLDLWQTSIEVLETRLKALEIAHPDVMATDCRDRMAEQLVLGSIYPLSESPASDDAAEFLRIGGGTDMSAGNTLERLGLALTPAGQLCKTDEAEEALPCKVRLAYGFYSHYLNKLRNHLVFETARELMTGRDMMDDKVRLERQARVQAEALEDFVDDEGYHRGNCETLIETRVAAGGALTEAVTTTDAEMQYAVNLDSVGLLTLAAAVRDDDLDGIERALGLFERSLDLGRNFGDGILLVVRDHRRQARGSLGLTD
jgi:hypothetical protein